ncbi:MAG: hypothetical protein M3O46_01385 [Myxococcota bacterium]|nr:hypothetical protein [Myxococcota bacterium]
MSGGPLDASVTLDELLTVVAAGRVPLAPELAGYLALEIAEHADPGGGDVDPKSVYVGDEGTVALVRLKRERVSGDAEASIRSSLARLLEASGSQTPSLAAASKRRNGGGLPALAEELEAALIPVNRAAGRRALARLAREVKRVTLGVGRHTLPSPSSPRSKEPASPASSQPGPARPPTSTFSREEDPTTTRAKVPSELMKRTAPVIWSETSTTECVPRARAPSASQADVDTLIAQFGVSAGNEYQQVRALKAIAGLEPTPPAPTEMARRIGRDAARTPPESASTADSGVDALLAMNSDARTDAAPASSRPQRVSPAATRLEERRLPTQPAQLKSRTTSPGARSPAKKRGWGGLFAMALVAIGGGSYALWQIRLGARAHHAAAAAQRSETFGARDATSPPCTGTLLIADVPPHAEVLLHEGQAPVDVPRMPVGARLEFVATAEGYAPKRVVVPPGAVWDNGSDGKPRFEAAVQLDPSRSRGAGADPWPAGEPGSAVGGEGSPGTVHVVATPRGAEVWMLAGIGPEARIDHLRCDEDMDVLLAGPTTYRKRLHVRVSDFGTDDAPRVVPAKGSMRIAHVSAK